MAVTFAFNLLLAVIWVLLTGEQRPYNYVVGFGIGFGVLSLSSREYGQRMVRAAEFALFVLWQIVRSTWNVTRAIARPNKYVRPGIVAVPLDCTSPLEILLLATVITLTPGTISVETGSRRRSTEAETGGRVLFVHALSLDNADALAATIKHDFERRILGFTRGQGRTAGEGNLSL